MPSGRCIKTEPVTKVIQNLDTRHLDTRHLDTRPAGGVGQMSPSTHESRDGAESVELLLAALSPFVLSRLSLIVCHCHALKS
jgi:hypothetical protein